MLRHGADDDDMLTAIREGIARKPQRHFFDTAPTAVLRPMSALGG
jgi:molybdenum cofactor biosynthesis enzyme MoaA